MSTNREKFSPISDVTSDKERVDSGTPAEILSTNRDKLSPISHVTPDKEQLDLSTPPQILSPLSDVIAPATSHKDQLELMGNTQDPEGAGNACDSARGPSPSKDIEKPVVDSSVSIESQDNSNSQVMDMIKERKERRKRKREEYVAPPECDIIEISE